MESVLTKAGEEAARKAATEFAQSNTLGQGEEEDGLGEINPSERDHGKAWRVIENVCVVLLLPFFWLYDCFVYVIGARLFGWAEAAFIAMRNQAHLFLSGMKPYECSTRITTVNVVVLCSAWFMFIDQARLAFLPTDADYTLAVMNFVIWTILCLELIFEVFIRPDGYHKLIRSDKAFTPTTVRYISALHLLVEFFSLICFVPEFVCLFQTQTTCDGRPVFSFLHSTMLALTGPNRGRALAGRAFYAIMRLRVFGLVRHWKNMWINAKFLKGRQKLAAVESTHISSLDKTDKNDEVQHSEAAQARTKILQKHRDAALINASNIGTALMVTNSYRALAILCAILGLFPMITLIYFKGVTDSVAYDMIGQLQATNVLATIEDESNCQFLVDSVEAWVDSFAPRKKELITSKTDNFVIAMVIQPSRCAAAFAALDVGDLIFSQVACAQIERHYELELTTSYQNCTLGALKGAKGGDLREIVHDMGLRVGNVQTEESEEILQSLTLNDGSESDVTYAVLAHFNHTHGTENS
jgi:hypothetical protein